VRRAVPEHCQDQPTFARCVEMVRCEYAQRWADKTKPYEGVPELLDALTARAIPMGVLSNKPDQFTRLCVTHLLPRWRFQAILGATPQLARKPDPAGALQVAAQLGVLPAQVLYLGDTNTDMQTAVAAGMFPVGALWGFRTAEELLASGAKALIQKPLELLCFFEPVQAPKSAGLF